MVCNDVRIDAPLAYLTVVKPPPIGLSTMCFSGVSRGYECMLDACSSWLVRDSAWSAQASVRRPAPVPTGHLGPVLLC